MKLLLLTFITIQFLSIACTSPTHRDVASDDITDLYTIIRTLTCNNEKNKFVMIRDSAIENFYPTEIYINDKKVEGIKHYGMPDGSAGFGFKNVYFIDMRGRFPFKSFEKEIFINGQNELFECTHRIKTKIFRSR